MYYLKETLKGKAKQFKTVPEITDYLKTKHDANIGYTPICAYGVIHLFFIPLNDSANYGTNIAETIYKGEKQEYTYLENKWLI